MWATDSGTVGNEQGTWRKVARAFRTGLRDSRSLFWTLLLSLGLSGSVRADLLVASFDTGQILRYDDATGVFVGVFATGLEGDHPIDMTIGPDGNLYVGVRNFGVEPKSFIRRFDGRSGTFIDTFASDGGLIGPHDLVFGPDGNLYVASFGGTSPNSKVIRYDGVTGAYIDDFVPVGSGGLQGVQGMTFGPDGNLYVTSRDTNQVLRYVGATGAFLGVFATVMCCGPRDLVFGPDGNLYVIKTVDATLSIGEVVRFDGATGEFIDSFTNPFPGGLDGTSLVFGPDGNLYVTTGYADSSVRRFAGSTGEPGIFVGSQSGGLDYAVGLLFAPQLCNHLGEYGPCADGAGTRCRADGVTGVGRSLRDVSRIDVLDCGPSDGAGGFEITPDCPSDYSYCVQSANDGVGNRVKLGVVERKVINDLVTLAALVTSFDPTPVPNGPAGRYSITATFFNTHGAPVDDPIVRVTELSRSNLVLNAEAGAIGVGATVTPDVGADGVLSPGEACVAHFVIGLQVRRSFTFFVDLLGVPEP